MRGRALPVWCSNLFGTTLRPMLALATGLAAYGAVAVPAAATPAIVIDAQTGDVLYAEDATENWYPASLTKLMTFYVALAAIRDKKINLDTPILISRRAASQAPSKMGFKPGTELTLGNALKMMMVKSANDLAVAIAEGVSGSVDAFAEDMNARRRSSACGNRISTIRTACPMCSMYLGPRPRHPGPRHLSNFPAGSGDFEHRGPAPRRRNRPRT